MDLVLDRLADAGSAVRGIADGWMAQCPAHPDRNPSLHVTEGDNGNAVLHCHAGCLTSHILDALKLAESDLFADAPARTLGDVMPLRPLSTVVTTKPVRDYIYMDADGEPVVKVTRFVQLDGLGVEVGKTFRQYRREGDEWVPGLDGVTPPLYRLPEVIAAVRAGQLVLVVEGEKDADRAAALGLCATTAPMGAGKWRDEHTRTLAGAVVVVLADDDVPGRGHAQTVTEALRPVARTLVTALPAEGCKDLSDMLDAGHPLSAIRPILPERLAEAPEQLPQDELHGRAAILRSALVTSAGLDDIPPPRMLIADLLQTDSLAWLQGRPGTAKTFLALGMAGSVGTGLPWQDGRRVLQGPVLYLLAEGLSGLKGRVRAWEKLAGRRMDGVSFLPVAVQLLSRTDLGGLCLVVAEVAPALIVIDTQARATVGAEENSARDMGMLVEALETLRAVSGACVLVVHHEGRSGDHLRGSSALEGAATTVMRVDKDGADVTLSCLKQKDICQFDDVQLRMVPAEQSVVPVVVPPDGQKYAGVDMSGTESRLLAFVWDLGGTTGVTWTEMKEHSGIPRSSIGRARNGLLSGGLIKNIGTDLRPRYVAMPPFGPTSPTRSHDQNGTT